ncbi:hypothetical protein BDZ91DRAFT_766780 [Kalaharituber pfeilii]|nr:hypothetical protein BDZ91DRAFT_766780 [Kalaharituber pfeilii]
MDSAGWPVGQGYHDYNYGRNGVHWADTGNTVWNAAFGNQHVQAALPPMGLGEMGNQSTSQTSRTAGKAIKRRRKVNQRANGGGDSAENSSQETIHLDSLDNKRRKRNGATNTRQVHHPYSSTYSAATQPNANCSSPNIYSPITLPTPSPTPSYTSTPIQTPQPLQPPQPGGPLHQPQSPLPAQPDPPSRPAPTNRLLRFIHHHMANIHLLDERIAKLMSVGDELTAATAVAGAGWSPGAEVLSCVIEGLREERNKRWVAIDEAVARAKEMEVGIEADAIVEGL